MPASTTTTVFTVEGAEAYRTHLKDVEVHLLDTGHFALEEITRSSRRTFGGSSTSADFADTAVLAERNHAAACSMSATSGASA